MLTYLDVAVFFAEIKNTQKLRIVACLELLSIADATCLYSNFNGSIVAKDLVETKFFPSIFRKDIPVLNEIYQFYVTFLVLRARHKNYLSLQSHDGFVRGCKATNL